MTKKLSELTQADVEAYPPGSADAVKLYGCKCDPERNGEGAGAYADLTLYDGRVVFEVDEACPLHGRMAKAARLGIKLPRATQPAVTQSMPAIDEMRDDKPPLFRFPQR